jgi:hypothetical protein
VFGKPNKYIVSRDSEHESSEHSFEIERHLKAAEQEFERQEKADALVF